MSVEKGAHVLAGGNFTESLRSGKSVHLVLFLSNFKHNSGCVV